MYKVVWNYLCFQDIQGLYAIANNDDQTELFDPSGIQTVMLIGG